MEWMDILVGAAIIVIFTGAIYFIMNRRRK
jgi:hypothetical protein